MEWATLEEFARLRIQQWLQDLLKEEVTERLGRPRYERRAAVDAGEGYRNGYGRPRRLAMRAGTITIQRPRVRGLGARFESRILPLFVRRTEEVAELLPQLYLHGLAQGDCELALRGRLGDGAPLSPASIERLRAKWTQEYAAWRTQRLDQLEVVYAWADGLYAEALIWKVRLIAEKKFRRLNAPGLLEDVYAGKKFVDGLAGQKANGRVAA